jgi:predicted NACHT family NTPase
MTDRSLTATEPGIKQAKLALKRVQLNQTTLAAARLGVARKTVSNFFTGKPVSDEIFFRICEVLKLDWQEIAGIVGPQTPNAGGFETGVGGSAPPALGAGGLPDIDTLVQQVRSSITPLIREQCGMMRVLDMDQPIELTGENGIYTNVNILEKQSRLRSNQTLNYDFDNRKVHEKGISGLEAVEKHRRLIVLGKPGAGKTTFLKHLVMQCIAGGFAADKVPFFVTLKHFAEAAKSPSLVAYLTKDLTVETVDRLLASGHALVFLDGLDEVREEDTKHVIREILSITCKSGENQFIITCRIAAKEYSFEPFTEVEVADFDEKQIATFAENWFRAKNDLLSAETFVQRLGANKPIQELAKTPILLTLLCLVFDRDKDFPTKRVDLYEQGIDLLLEDWDKKRDVQRDRIDRNIDLPFIKNLLSHIAFASFTEQTLIEYKQLERYIADFIQTLPPDSVYAELSRIDCKTLIKSIQAHHGLLVERAHRTYSFSHLTFQEYFTARQITTTKQINFLVARITEKRWREVFLLVAGIVQIPDELLIKMKSRIDFLLCDDPKIQHFLRWVNQKSLSAQVNYKLAAVSRVSASKNVTQHTDK